MRSLRSTLFGGLLGVFLVLGSAGVADAKITVRRHPTTDEFFFHGNYLGAPFSPTDGFGLDIWNCADGTLPVFIADRVPLVVCDWNEETGYVLAERVYAVDLAPGACDDHGRSCYFRDPAVPKERDGVRYLRIRYASHGRGNRVWLQSYGDLSAATQANMLILIRINGGPRAVLRETFVPIPGGGWFSNF